MVSREQCCGSTFTGQMAYTRVKHFRPNLGSFFRGSTYTRNDLYMSIYGTEVAAAAAACVVIQGSYWCHGSLWRVEQPR